MSKVSVIIPSRNERFLPQTVDDVFKKAAGEIECLAILDGYWPSPILANRPHLTLIHRTEPRGMRDAINSAVAISHGEYIMKCDAHCMVAPGFDEVLKKDCADNWVVIPRRHRLDAENWKIDDCGKDPIDYHHLTWPWYRPAEVGIHGEVWAERARQRAHVLIDEEMSSQGSCWFMTRKHFDWLGGLSEVGYGQFWQEMQEIGLKTWLGGRDGRMMINKKTTYSHLHKGRKYGRGYFVSKPTMHKGADWSTRYWMGNQWTERKHDIEWLIERFWPVPSWPADWREQLAQHRREWTDETLHG